MKVSLNTIKQFVDAELPPIDELVARINAQLGGVEEVIDLGAKYKDAKIVKVVECGKHENADRLSVCKVDVGEDELVQVVCGAPNVHADMWAVWLPPQSTVPSTYDDKEPFVLDARELRGVMSHGMLASAKELGLGDDHSGIVEVNEADVAQGKVLTPGASFAETFDLNDIIIDIENKMFTHRPDLFGQLGVAREIYAILQPELDLDKHNDVRFAEPLGIGRVPEFDSVNALELEVFNETPEHTPRLLAVAMENINIKPSPLWLQTTLLRWGSKPINNVVDLTNYIMLQTAQPTHAYDYDKLKGHKLGARLAKQGETITLLNDKTYELTTDDIVIADSERAVGLAGIMGGADSEVSAETKNIVLEVANFDMYAVRRSSMRHGLFTDALTRFNKGQSSLQQERVLRQLMNLMSENVGAKQASVVGNEPQLTGDFDYSTVHGSQQLSSGFINERLGLELTPAGIGNLLRYVNFASYKPDNAGEDMLEITAPFWRTDIELPEDIVEEVGRLYGFDKLPRELPKRSMSPTPKNQDFAAKQALRNCMQRVGANEVLTYSFVHEKLLKKSEQDPAQAFKLSNALSPDLQYYRLSVLPSLLDKVHANIKAGHDEFTIYEIGKGHNKNEIGEEGLPREINYVDAVYASKQEREGAAYYYVRALLDQLARDLGFELKFKPAPSDMSYQVTAPFEPNRSALVETADGLFIGMIGELKQTVKKNFKLPKITAAMSLDFENLKQAYYSPHSSYKPLSKYPSTSQDISLKVASDVAYADILATVYEATSSSEDLDSSVELLSIYQPKDSTDSLTYTFRITAVSHQRTLTDDDMSRLMNVVEQKAADNQQAVRI